MRTRYLLALLLGLGALAACETATPTTLPTATPSPVPTPTATATPLPTPITPRVTIGSVTFLVELAATAQQRQRGLSGRDNLHQDWGMLFLLADERMVSFWMKEMRFPVDIIWISAQGRIVDITHNAVPEPGVPDAELTRYWPQAPVAYVLEVNAGLARRHGFAVGDAVDFRGIPRELP